VNFVSAPFALFLALSYAGYWLLPRGRSRKVMLLAASYVFYAAWDWRFCGLMGVVTLNAWLAGRALDTGRNRRLVLWLSIGADLAGLAWFKYAGFLAANAGSALQALGLPAPVALPPILLPIGISFYTFHAISYVADIARGKAKPHGLVDVALYIAFFPQLVAGPISRAGFFLPQLDRAPRFSAGSQALGLRLIVKGLIYKALIADPLAGLADPGFASVSTQTDRALIEAVVAFAGQIYFDFAGYSALAIGTSRLFGYRLPKNFDYPYSALSPTEFWRRWHISLSSWLRDYVYIPLGGNRGGELLTYRNLLATMVLGGFWHGASWNFILWGAAHGLGLCLHKLWLKVRPGLIAGENWAWRGIALALTQFWVLLAWVPFRCASLADTRRVLGAFAALPAPSAPALLILALIAADHVIGRTRLPAAGSLKAMGRPIFWTGLGALGALIVASLPLVRKAFLYFQF
jgi:D-alanyl-lipoteichoic acid acyltransferase DltB (MBOAT superfamily)